ncbi:DUF4347 domain-containing protein, partial [Marinomonas hwangdonensis]
MKKQDSNKPNKSAAAKRAPVNKKQARKPLISALEPRLLLDGAAVVTAVEAFTDSQLHDGFQTDASQQDTDTSLVIAPTEVRAVDPALNNGKKEVVFIEDNVADYQTLIDGIGAGIEVVLLDSTQDGLAQMALWAQSNSDYDAIHIISHGAEGQVNLGGFSLDNFTVNTRSADLAQLGAALNEDGDLLLYGCEVASGEGQDFIIALAQATQADVAASDDLTGSAVLGGDWQLEFQQGQISETQFLDDSVEDIYHYTLAPVTEITSTFTGLGSSDTGGTGFKSLTDPNLVVSNGFIAANPDIYLNDVSSLSQQLIIKADNTDAESFDVSAVKLYAFNANGITIDSTSTIVFKDKTGVVLQTMTLNSDKVMAQNVDTNIFNMFDTGNSSPVTNVSSIEFNFVIAGSSANGNNFSSLTFKDITYTNVVAPAPTVTSATYDASTNSLVVTGTGMTTGDTITTGNLSLTGEGGASYTLTSANVTAASATSFTVALNAADQAHVESLLNKNGTASVGNTTFNIAAAANWDASRTTAEDLTGNTVTVSNYTATAVSFIETDADYGSATATKIVIDNTSTDRTITFSDDGGGNLLGFDGGGLYASNDVSGDGNGTQLTIDIESGYSFDLTGVSELGGSSTVTVSYTNADGSTGEPTALSSVFPLNDVKQVVLSSTDYAVFNDFLISDVKAIVTGPTVTSATYDASTNSLVVTGTGMTTGDTITTGNLSLTGEGGASYTLTSANVTAASATSFTVALNAADQSHVEGLLNKNGTASVGATTFNIAAAANWDASRTTAADLTGNGVTVSNVQTPTITSSTYDASTGVLTVTGSNLVNADGAANDITANKFTFKGDSSDYTLTDTSNVEITSATEFTITLSATDKAALASRLNKDGDTSTGGTGYNLAVADDWNTVITGGDTADLTGNGITVSNYTAPAVNAVFDFEAGTGTFTVAGDNASATFAHSSAGVTLTATALNDVIYTGSFGGVGSKLGGAETLYYGDNGEGTQLTFAITGYTFDISSIKLYNNGPSDTFTITTSKSGTQSSGIVADSTSSGVISMSGANFTGISSFTITSSNSFMIVAVDDINLSNITVASDTTAPTVTSIERQTSSSSITDADSVVYRVTFDEAVSAIDAADFSVSGTTATVTNILSAGGNAYDVTVSGGDLAALNSTVTLSFAGEQNITDTAGNALAATTPTGTNNSTYDVVNSPTVTTGDNTGDNLSFSDYTADLADGDGLSLAEALHYASANQTVAFDLASGSTVNMNGGTLTVASGVTFDTDSMSALTISNGTLSLGGNVTFTNGTSDVLTVSSTLAGSGALTKSGSGILTLTGANTYTGLTTVSAGTLAVAADSNLGSGAVSLNGGTLDVTANTTIDNAVTLTGDATIQTDSRLTLSGTVSGDGNTLTKTGSGDLKLSGNNSGSAMATTVTAGNLMISSNDNLGTGTLTLDGGTLYLQSASAITHGITLGSSGGTIQVTGSADSTVSGNITGSGALTKGGGRVLTLGGSNSFSGGFNIAGSAGGANVIVADGTNLGTGAVTLTQGLQITGSGTITNNFVLNGGLISNANGVILSGILSGSGNTEKLGAGTLSLSGTNTYTGTTTVSSGILSGTTSSLIGNIVNNASVWFDQSTTGVYDKVISGTGSVSIASDGSVEFSGVNTYSGQTVVGYLATLILSGGNALSDSGAVTVSSPFTLVLKDNETIGSLEGVGSINLSDYTLTTGGNNINTEFSGIIYGAGGITKVGSGIFTLSGENTYTGATAVSAGNLVASGGSAIADTSALTVSSGATFELDNFDSETVGSIAGTGSIVANGGTLTVGGNNTSTTFSGVMSEGSEAVALIKLGSGTLTLSGSNSYTGATTVSAGTLSVTGTLNGPNAAITTVNAGTLEGSGSINSAVLVNSGATLSAGITGSAGTLTINGDLSFDEGVMESLIVDESHYDKVVVNGTVTLSNNSSLSLSGDYVVPAAAEAQSFELLSNDGSDAITGRFSSLTEGAAKTFNSVDLATSYVGSTGNDFLLTGTAIASVTGVSATTDDGHYKVGDTIAITVAFSKAVTVDTTNGTPQLTLETGTTDRVANYVSGTGSDTLTFSYTVQEGDTSSDLDYISTAALVLSNGTIKDGTNDAILTLPTPNSSGSLAVNKAIVIDTTAPSATSTPDLATVSDTGVSSTDNITNDNTPTVTGTAEANATVKLYDTDGTTELGTTTADGSGNWAIASSALSAGAHTLTTKATDAAGNVSVASSGLTITIDTTGPTLSSSSPADNAVQVTQSGDIILTFDEDISGISGVDNISLVNVTTGVTVESFNAGTLTILGKTLTITPSADLDEATMYAIRVDGNAVRDIAGNTYAGISDNTTLNFTTGVTDSVAPTFLSIQRTSDAVITGSTTSFTLTFNEAVDVTAADFVLAITGSVAGTIGSISGSGTNSITVNVTGVSGVGSLGLNLASDHAVKDLAGNNLATVEPADDEAYTVDTVAPTLISINRVDSATTNADSVQFIAVFSETVTGLGIDDFELTGTATNGANISSVTGTGNGFVITVAGVTGDGTLGVQLKSAATVTDTATNALTTTTASAVTEQYTIDNSAPTATAIITTNTALSTADSVTFNVTFSEAVTHVSMDDFEISGDVTGTVSAVSGSGSSYTVTVSNVVGDGALGLNFKSGQNMTDIAGNALAVTEPTTDESYAIDNTLPTVTSISRGMVNQVKAGTATDVVFTVVFSETVSDIAMGDFAVTGNATNTGVSSVSSADGKVFKVTVSGVNGSIGQTVGLSFTGSVNDAVNQASTAQFTAGDHYTIAGTLLNEGALSQAQLDAIVDLNREGTLLEQSVADAKQVVIIDSRVPGLVELTKQANPEADIWLLDGSRSATEQITEILANYNDLDALHILSHGGAGEIYLGAETLSADAINQNSATFAAWDNALSDSGDILLYGCNVAQGDTGIAFINQLAQVTGANIAASDDLTGSAELGGDWELEVKSGEVETNGIELDSYGDTLIPTSSVFDMTNATQVSSPAADSSIGDGKEYKIQQTVDGVTVTISSDAPTGNPVYNTLLDYSNGGFSGKVFWTYVNNVNQVSLVFSEPVLISSFYGTYGGVAAKHGVPDPGEGPFIWNVSNGSNSAQVSVNMMQPTQFNLSSLGAVTQLTITSSVTTGHDFVIDTIQFEKPASDTAAPTFDSTPSVSNISATTVDLETDIDEAGKVYYVVVADGAQPPTAAQVKAGVSYDDNNGRGATVITSGNATVSGGDFSNTFNVTGLTASTSYDIYVVAEDDESTPNMQSSVTKVDVTTIAPPNQAPVISDAEAGQAVNDASTVAPFSSMSLSDADNDNVSITVALDTAAKGAFTAASLTASGFTDNNNGTYSLASTTVASAQAALRQLVFSPADNRVAPGSTETTTFTITVNDGTANGTDNITTVISTSVNDAPTDISLSDEAFSHSEGSANVVVGSFSATDADTGESFTYSLVAGTGDTDNGKFNIDGANLRVTDRANVPAGTYSIRVQVNDGDATFEKSFSITVSDDIAPTISAVVPADNATGVSVADSIEITFDEGVQLGNAGTITLYDITGNGANSLTIDVGNHNGQLAIVGNKLTINPTNNLMATNQYAIQITAGALTDSSDNALAAISDTISYNFTTGTVDTTAPTVAIVDIADPTQPNAGTVTINFSEQVTNVDISDFTLTKDGSPVSLSGITVEGSGSAYTLNLSSVTTAEGIYVLTLNTSDITDTSGNALSAGDSETFIIDTTAPAGVAIVRTGAENQNGSAATFTAVFNEAVSGVDAADFVLTGTAAGGSITSVTQVSDSVYTITVNGVSGDGTLGVNLKDSGTGITDTAGNAISAGVTGQQITIDNTGPSVVAINRDGAVLTTADSTTFTVTFDEAVTGVDVSDFSLFGGASGTVASISGSGATYQVTVNNISGDGSLRLDIKASGTGITDTVSNAIGAGFTSGDTLTIDNTAPVVTASQAFNLDEGMVADTVIGQVKATDTNGVSQFLIQSGNDNGYFAIDNNGVVTLTSVGAAAIDYETATSYTLDIVATDAVGQASSAAAVTISINDINDNAPVFSSAATASLAENTVVTTPVYTAAATDDDGTPAYNSVTYSLKATGDHDAFTIDTATGEVKLKAAADYETKSSYSFTVIASDGMRSVEKGVTVSVNDLNDNTPVITSGATG